MKALLIVLEFELKAVRALLSAPEKKIRKAAAIRERDLEQEISRLLRITSKMGPSGPVHQG